VQSGFGWREGFNAPAASVQKLNPRGLPVQAFLGAAGMPGLTAYAGLLRIAALKDGDVVFVSGAAGAVGSIVCQIAKAKGHKVIGSAGGPEKVAFLKSIGVDHAIDYKAEKDLTAAILAGAPDGIDVYFENVGGEHLEAALNTAKLFARFAICGMISIYNATTPQPGPSNLAMLIGKNIRMEGFIVSHHFDLMPKYIEDLSGWVKEGKVTWKETIFEGLDKAPDAFLGLFKGENLGKMLVKLA
jgi:NADPH-dependent curcumin reductase CurA